MGRESGREAEEEWVRKKMEGLRKGDRCERDERNTEVGAKEGRKRRREKTERIRQAARDGRWNGKIWLVKDNRRGIK